MGFFRLITRSPGTGASYWKSLRHSILPHCDWNGVLIFLFLFIYFLTPKTFYIGGIADSQCCASFRWTMQGLSLTYTRIHSPPKPAPTQAGTWNWAESPCYRIGFCWLSTLNTTSVSMTFPKSWTVPSPLATIHLPIFKWKCFCWMETKGNSKDIPWTLKKTLQGTFLAAQRLGRHAFTAGGLDSIPG